VSDINIKASMKKIKKKSNDDLSVFDDLLENELKSKTIQKSKIDEIIDNVDLDINIDELMIYLEKNDISVEEEKDTYSIDLEETADDLHDPLKIYLNQIAKFPLLKAEDEHKITKRIAFLSEKINELSQITDKITDKRKLPKAQTELKEIEEEIQKHKDALVKANLRLVVSIAKRYQNSSMQILDLINEGNIGLIEAIERFDYTKGYRFSTYGTWWIKQAIVKALADKGRLIRIPLHMLNTIKKCYQISKSLTQKLGRNPNIEELSDVMKLPPQKIIEIIRASFDTGSLETPLDDDNNIMLREVIEDKEYNSESPIEKVFRLSLHDLIYKILDKLKEKEKLVIELRYGLKDGKPYTLEETGKELGITRERVRQIQEKSLKRIKNFNITKELKEFIKK